MAARAEAHRALEEVGTNAFPFLLALFDRRPSKIKTNLNHLLAKHSLTAFRFPREPDYPKLAREAFRELGTHGRSAIPPLIELLDRKDDYEVANVSETLWRMLPDSADALTAALTNQDKSIRANAAYCLCGNAGAITAIPALKQALRDEDSQVRVAAADVLVSLWISDPEELAIPVLCQSLHELNPTTRLRAAFALETHARHAKMALPNLIERLKDNNTDVRIAAASALLSIDVYEANKVGVYYRNTDPFPRK